MKKEYRKALIGAVLFVLLGLMFLIKLKGRSSGADPETDFMADDPLNRRRKNRFSFMCPVRSETRACTGFLWAAGSMKHWMPPEDSHKRRKKASLISRNRFQTVK